MTQVLITRPLTPANELAAQLRSHGLTPIVMPFYSFSALQPVPGMTDLLSAARGRKLAVFTSPRAVRFGLPHLTAALKQSLEFAAIGMATRAQLEALGCKVHLQAAGGYTSEDLLQLPGLDSAPGSAVIFCAPGGRETLASGLEALGWNVVKSMVYERVEVQPAAEQIESIMRAGSLLTVWTSISALELARKQLPAAAWDRVLCTPALVISQRIQHHLHQLGASCVELADGPGNADLLRAILRLAGNAKNACA
jgi:uroporphyrinogen-III synthase